MDPIWDDAAVRRDLRICLEDLQAVAKLGPGKLLVVGGSTSEIVGKRIGTATSLDIGVAVVETVLEFVQGLGCHVAFQCCEHLNRSLVVSAASMEFARQSQVSAVPVPGAGGAVAATAYFRLHDACLVGAVQADAGIDIGDTLIGMHLRPVVVPVRGRLRSVGQAHVTMATTRPPLIGGSRAVYDVAEARRRITYGEDGRHDL